MNDINAAARANQAGDNRVFVGRRRFNFDDVDFVTSDHHFGHERIIELAERPFTSLDEMHRAIIESWNRVVSPNDVVLHLGDLALGHRDQSIGITAALNGRKLLVPGNHDTISSVYVGSEHSREITRHALELNGWEVLPEILDGTRHRRRLIASHYPYEGDSHGEDRHGDARPKDRGFPLLHGHTHDRTGGPHGHMFHVGVDGNNFTPVPMTEIDRWIDSLDDSAPSASV